MGDFKGMNPALAKTAMAKIQSKKAELDTESKTASSVLNDCVTRAFAGTQTGAMQGFVERINVALEKLYSYLDGSESNFASTLDKAIESYVVSDENVGSAYNNSDVE